jgi:ribosome-binding factor A
MATVLIVPVVTKTKDGITATVYLTPFLDRDRDALNHRNKASKGASDKRGLSKVSP